MALWIVATPIGSLDDLGARARQVLASAAVVAAEDTRHTMVLFEHHGIAGPRLTALHAHNEDERADALVTLAATSEVALVSDAGTPGISDPGRVLVERAHRAGVEIRSVPGPSALAAALAASGFPAAPSTFLGFPPRKGREGFAREVLARPETVVLYEAPDRVAGLVADLASLQPTREACLCREISKKFEEIRRAPLADLAANLAARESVRGEVVLVIGPGDALVEVQSEVAADAGVKDVARALAERWGVPRNAVYQELLALKDRL